MKVKVEVKVYVCDTKFKNHVEQLPRRGPSNVDTCSYSHLQAPSRVNIEGAVS